MSQPHILIVDDDELIIEALTSHLERMGCRITTAGCCREALERLSAKDPLDLVGLDYCLSDGLGQGILKICGRRREAAKTTSSSCPQEF